MLAVPANTHRSRRRSRSPSLCQISLTRDPVELPEPLSLEYENVGQDPLGEGAFAIVKLVRHRTTHEQFALKCIDKYQLNIRGMAAQMEQEVLIHQALDHPNILKLVRVVDAKDYLFMLLEFCGGGTLRDHLDDAPGRRLPEPEAAKHFEQVVRGTECMHRHQCIHRDLKLENVLFTSAGVVKICDFGWSTQVQMKRQQKTKCGTMAHWAPEQWDNGPQDEGVDMWALGCMLYEMVAGQQPFPVEDQDELRRRVLSVQFVYAPWFSNEVCHILHCLLQREPHHRTRCKELMGHMWFDCRKAHKTAVPVPVHTAAAEEAASGIPMATMPAPSPDLGARRAPNEVIPVERWFSQGSIHGPPGVSRNASLCVPAAAPQTPGVPYAPSPSLGGQVSRNASIPGPRLASALAGRGEPPRQGLEGTMRVRSQSPPPRQLPSQSMAAFAHSMAVPAGGGPVGTEFPRSPPTVLPLHIQDGRWASGGLPAEAGRGSHGAHSVSVQMLQSRRPASPPPGQMHAGRRLQPATPPAGHPAGCLPGGPPPAAGGPPSPSTVQAYQQTMLQGSQVSPQHPVMPLPGNMVPPVVLPPPAPATCAVQCNTPGVPPQRLRWQAVHQASPRSRQCPSAPCMAGGPPAPYARMGGGQPAMHQGPARQQQLPGGFGPPLLGRGGFAF